ncbi:MAG: T9SS type A sorting domain-containing protein [Ignavibacteriota bacterium]
MNRRTLIKSAGIAGLTALIPFKNSRATQSAISRLKDHASVPEGSCVLIPTETAGPYPWPKSPNGSIISTDQFFYRRDITEGLPGLPLTVTLNIVNVNDDCAPVLNAAVVIWHCNKDGQYSEYGGQLNYLTNRMDVDETGKSFMRGVQMTDSNGQVTFNTIYPGWYPGRTSHVHFQVFLSSLLNATSQFAFPENINQAVYGSALYSGHGQKDTPNTSDGVFNNNATDLTHELLTDIQGDTTSGYTATFTIGIAAPKSGVIDLEPETGGQFKLAQNYPNPFTEFTTIPFTLTNAADVMIELFDSSGKRIVEVVNRRMEAGDQRVALGKDINGVHLHAGGYVYQITVANSGRVFRQSKMLTVL